jgi:hypothetical protein
MSPTIRSPQLSPMCLFQFSHSNQNLVNDLSDQALVYDTTAALAFRLVHKNEPLMNHMVELQYGRIQFW